MAAQTATTQSTVGTGSGSGSAQFTRGSRCLRSAREKERPRSGEAVAELEDDAEKEKKKARPATVLDITMWRARS